ncbi:MAG TPA: carboxypeptidase-like regulatory domain-containing protein [Vicinamibacterales bacterium]|nr:carboxypeptidase-like regulatory domain-containing protein [Vicinamibacterales bacterium]
MKYLTVLTLAVTMLAQTPPRDAPIAPTGTATISGTVVTESGDGRPLRLATVSLTGGGFRGSLIALTDERGQFVFRDLPAGRFSLSAERAGYVATDYGAQHAGGLGMPIVLKADEHATVTVKLAKGAVIGGTVTGPDVQPASSVPMRLMQYVPNPNNGERQLTAPRAVHGWHWQQLTDDRGSYRFYGLPPGDYYVLALPQLSASARLPTSSEFDWARAVLQAPGSAPAAPPAPGPVVSFAPVLYPGTADSLAAGAITVSAAEERLGMDFALQYVATATVSGVIVDPDGRPPQGSQGSLIMPSASLFISTPMIVRPAADGKFSLSGVLPGQYVLAMRGAAGTPAGTAPQSAPAQQTLWALMDVVVDGRDLSNLQVRLAPGMTVSGRVVFDGSSAKPPDDLRLVRINLQPIGEGVTVTPQDVQASQNGTFVMTGVGPGRYRLNALLPAAQAAAWTLLSATMGGTESLDFPFEVRPGTDVSDATVTFTDKPTEITGTLFDAAGRPTPKYFIMVFSTDRTMWRANSRRVRYVRPGNTGEFRLAGVPPGEYYVCALTDLDFYEMYSSEFLDPLAAAAMKMTLAAGEKRVQDLKIAALPSPQRH